MDEKSNAFRQHLSNSRKRVVVLAGLSLLLTTSSNPLLAFSPLYPLRRSEKVSVKYKQSFLKSSEASVLPNVNNKKEATVQSKDGTSVGKAGWIDADQLNELKENVDIISVVESYGLDRFERRGDSRATAICPFHDDHSPSLSIDGSRRIYKCFSCGAGGDVFRFVQEYSKLQGEEISYYQAARHVSAEFGDGALALQSSSPGMSNEEREQLRRKKDRIYLANAAAADFYSDCLRKPSGGFARYHLLSRGFPPAAVLTFALGFAPDCYYPRGSANPSWGEGSLVFHLKGLGFTPRELLDAGLAIQTKRNESPAGSRDTTRGAPGAVAESIGAESTDTSLAEDLEYSSLMDRFRGRLVIPILDSSGKRVLGFGGRLLSDEDNHRVASDFQGPKYLNSPESSVFQKKRILFGQHLAKEALRVAKSNGDNVAATSVVLVEGYMDAIALWAIGITGAVSCMGTALSSEQMSAAARIAGAGNGRVVLCLDNDEAGVAAVERLCSNGILSDTVTKHRVEIAVASLPDGKKDPAEFVQSQASSPAEFRRVSQEFRKEVIQTAVDWSDWYLHRIIGAYDPSVARGRPGSFLDVFERIAKFLANSFSKGERTKRAYEVSQLLAGVLAKEQNSTEPSNAVRGQLECDLIDAAARAADAKEAVLRRTEAVSGESGARSALAALSRGHGPNSEDDRSDKLSWRNSSGSSQNYISTSMENNVSTSPQDFSGKTRPMNTAMETVTMEKPLTPHFNGVQCAYKSDKDWLESKQPGLVLGLKSWKKRVYFNSNDYHGREYLTDDARNAGYTTGEIPYDQSLFEKGIASLAEPDWVSMLLQAEDALLKELVLHREVRTTIRNMLDARTEVDPGVHIEWSSSEKRWLFSCLVDRMGDIPTELRSPEELRLFLAGQPNSPPGAFQMPNASDSTLNGLGGRDIVPDGPIVFPSRLTGSLDHFFIEEHGLPDAGAVPSIPTGIRHECHVRYLFQNFLKACKARRAYVSGQEVIDVVGRTGATVQEPVKQDAGATEKLPGEEVIENANQSHPGLVVKNGANNLLPGSCDQPPKLDKRINGLIAELNEAMRSSHALVDSSKRATRRLMDEAGSDRLEGTIPVALQAELASKLDDHLQNVTEMSKNELTREGEQGTEPYEDTLEQIEKDWGEWCSDDYVWRPEDSLHKSMLSPGVFTDDFDEEDEPIEEQIARIDERWGDLENSNNHCPD